MSSFLCVVRSSVDASPSNLGMCAICSHASSLHANICELNEYDSGQLLFRVCRAQVGIVPSACPHYACCMMVVFGACGWAGRQ